MKVVRPTRRYEAMAVTLTNLGSGCWRLWIRTRNLLFQAELLEKSQANGSFPGWDALIQVRTAQVSRRIAALPCMVCLVAWACSLWRGSTLRSTWYGGSAGRKPCNYCNPADCLPSWSHHITVLLGHVRDLCEIVHSHPNRQLC
jgi:hypothetical protein